MAKRKSNDAGQADLSLPVACLRCERPCRTGTPDPAARAIRRAAISGFCPNCMITHFLCSIEGFERPIREHGAHILFGGSNPDFDASVKQCIKGILSHTQMREDEIDWIEVVTGWDDPWPKGREPKPGDI